jgi:hypothetical protein
MVGLVGTEIFPVCELTVIPFVRGCLVASSTISNLINELVKQSSSALIVNQSILYPTSVLASLPDAISTLYSYVPVVIAATAFAELQHLSVSQVSPILF